MSTLVLDVISSDGDLEAAGISLKGTAKGAEDVVRLDLTGAREFLTHETAEELLAPMLAPGSKIQAIKFSTKSFGIDAAEVAARAIRNISATLVDADMSDIIAGRPEDEALAALRILSNALATCNLHHLNLSDNALGEKGIRACAASFENQEFLESISFQNVGCSVHGCAAVDELLKCTSHLKKLHLLNNMSGDEGAVSISNVLARSPCMEEFKMASSRIGAAGGIAIGKALSQSGAKLISLDLHDNPLTGEAAPSLAAAISCHSCLKRLNLNDTCLEDHGVSIIASALASSAGEIEELELELNEISVKSANILAAALKGKSSLRKLNLKENELEDEGAVAITKGIIGLQNLETIDMCINQIKRGGACALAKAAVTLPSLILLELNENEISEAGIDALKEILTKADKLNVLGSLEDNMPDEDDEDDDEKEGDSLLDADIDDLAKELQREHL